MFSEDCGFWSASTASEAVEVEEAVAMDDILHGTPRSTLHLPVTGSGGAILIKGGSSRNPTVK